MLGIQLKHSPTEDHVVSRVLGERDGSSVVWDYLAIYQPGKLWDEAPPKPVYSRVPVVRSISGARDAIRQWLESKHPGNGSSARLRWFDVQPGVAASTLDIRAAAR